MAYVGSANVAITTRPFADYFFTLKTALLSAGWVVVSSGTGTGGTWTGTNQVVDNITSAAVFSAANAWVRVREPVGDGTLTRREYVFQNATTTGTSGWVKYSRGTGFGTGGAAAVMPTTGVGGDGVMVIGSTSDLVPGAAGSFTFPSGYCAAVASNTVSPGPYGAYAFYLLGWTAGTVPAALSLFFSEAVAAGSTSALDQDPTIRSVAASSTLVGPTSGYSWWQAYGLAGATYQTGGCGAMPYTTTGILPVFTFASVSPYDAKVPMYPLLVLKFATLPKGYTTGILQFNTTQNQLDTFNLSSADPRIAICTQNGAMGYNTAMPWLTSVTPTV